jgi:hypothetical protein
LKGADSAITKKFAQELNELTAHPHLFSDDDKTMDVCARWDRFCADFFHAYQDLALAEVGE